MCRLISIKNKTRQLEVLSENSELPSTYKKQYDPQQFASTSFNTSSEQFNLSNRPINVTKDDVRISQNNQLLPIWQQELEIAMYDNPIEQLYPKVYKNIAKTIQVYTYIKLCSTNLV